ncbi:GNAT family N-acetyltransferase [Colwellia sp. MB3u-4]|uniref:GNAT family N-acetyltransferase n=1 Tax=Colwellia sp. MB3u-4 TaxID=2759822 RepID=UPI0015F58F4D|nr:GNAT family N-acetyltransferase [Colwellia sp. MB3u-4]MBA6289979.1 GNAT family N-acetyltransferase [Colwellia sp. MB3u-4]
MFNLFKKKAKEPQFTIRHGVQKDIDFVVKQIVEDSKYGYFARGMPAKLIIDNQNAMLNASIKRQFLQMQTDYGLSHHHSSIFVIFESCENELIGFALVLCDVESEDKLSEILVAGIRPEMRGNGYGKVFIKMLVSDLIKQTPLKARCYKESTIM